mgnify:CR=1 FL=1
MGTGNLQQLLSSFLTTEADWKKDHCAFAAADVSQAITGIDPIAPVREKIKGKMTALRFRESFSRDPGEAMRIIAEEHCGLLPIDPKEAKPGDMGTVVAIDEEGKQIEIAACRMDKGWFVRGESGYARTPAAKRAWTLP